MKRLSVFGFCVHKNLNPTLKKETIHSTSYIFNMTFKELNIIEPILKAITEKGYTHPTPIQENAIPVVLTRLTLS